MALRSRPVLMLPVFFGLTALAAFSGGTFRPGSWYAALAKPAWTPPPAVFPPVWGALYVLIALAGWLAWRAAGWSRPLGFWVAQLVLNAAWSLAMFGAHRIDWAMADLVLLWISIVGFMVSNWPHSRAAAVMFLPYWIWVSFAGVLNFSVLRLNM